MYRVETSGALLRGHRTLLARRGLVPRTVILLGLTNFLTDVSAEMVATVLPLYLVFAVGLTPLQFGLIDGLYQGSAALVRIGSGLLGNRVRRHKEVASFGYALCARAASGPLLTTIGLGLMTASDGFVYLALQRRMDFELRLFPLLFVGTAAVYMVLAAPIGRLADRFAARASS